MKKRLRFQTRLLLAFLVTTLLVTTAIIELTGKKVKNAYQRQFRKKFDDQVRFIMDARDQRSRNTLALGNRLAGTEFVISRLKKGEKKETGGGEAAREFFRTFTQSGGSRPKAPPSGAEPQKDHPSSARGFRILAVMDLEGDIRDLDPDRNRRMGRQSPKGRSSILKQLENLQREETAAIAYLPIQVDGVTTVRDVMVTPVRDPGTGDFLGALLMSLSTAETGAERLIDRYHEKVGGGHFENAIFIDGKLHPSGVLGDARQPSVAEQEKLTDLEAAASTAISALDGGRTEGSFEAGLHGAHHYVHFCALNPDSPLPTAWQISAFPMTELQGELKDLRIKGAGIGMIGLLIGLISATVFSRNLAVPIRQLAEGTRGIREGELDISLPVRSRDEIGELTESFNLMASELRQKERYRALLEKVSDESVAQAMIEGSLNPELGGEVKEVTVLFCDIRGFTTLTEEMSPESVIEMLNQHMTAMTRVVREHCGVVDKFIGDEIMAVFGGLKSYGDDAANAARCALRMLEERARLDGEQGTAIPIGIGIVTGEVVAGCMGSSDRLNYTVLGARVNLASRLCNHAGPGQVLIDDRTLEEISPARCDAEKMENLRLKGFRSHVAAWSLRGIRSAASAPVTSPVGG